jgi:hypothetical protein
MLTPQKAMIRLKRRIPWFFNAKKCRQNGEIFLWQKSGKFGFASGC